MLANREEGLINQLIGRVELSDKAHTVIRVEPHQSIGNAHSIERREIEIQKLAFEHLETVLGESWAEKIDAKLAPDTPSGVIFEGLTQALSKAYFHRGDVNVASAAGDVSAAQCLQDFTTAIDYWKDLEKSAELVGYCKLDDWQERRAFWKEFGQETTLKVLAEQTKDEIKDHLKDAAKEFLGEKGKEQFEHFTKGVEKVETAGALPSTHLEASPNGSSTMRCPQYLFRSCAFDK